MARMQPTKNAQAIVWTIFMARRDACGVILVLSQKVQDSGFNFALAPTSLRRFVVEVGDVATPVRFLALWQ